MRLLGGPARRWLLLSLAAALACAINPVTGQRELILMSPQREAALGAQAAEQVEAEMGLVRDPALEAYVDVIGQRLARNSPRQDVQYRFFVADMPEPNAFALPGGYIYVSRGLLAIANGEDELANVIGHEIGHVAARHSAQRETRALGVGLLTVLGTVAAGAAGGDAAARTVSQLGQVAGAGLIAAYGRDQERQADEVGQKLAAESGWDPAGMTRFMDTLGRETERALGEPRRPTFLDSHPTTTERVQTTAERARSLAVAPGRDIARTKADFYARFEGLLVGPNPEEGVFRDQLFLHPGLDFALAFPSGWLTQNGKQAVAAQAPGEDAIVVLEGQGPPTDPRDAARQWADANQIPLTQGAQLRIGGYDAYRGLAQVQGQSGDVVLYATWIAHPKGTFRILGVTSPERFRAYESSFGAVSGSFRALNAREASSITARRLHVVSARRGETLAALSERTGNRWSVEETAVANALSSEVRFAGGEPVKIVLDVALGR